MQQEQDMRLLAYEFRVSSGSEETPAAPHRALPIEGLEELHCPHSGLLVITLAVQGRRHQPRLSRKHFHASTLCTPHVVRPS